MPFSSFSDSADIARAQSALEIAWSRIKRLVIEDDREREHARLVFIIASLAHASYDEEELAERAWNATGSGDARRQTIFDLPELKMHEPVYEPLRRCTHRR